MQTSQEPSPAQTEQQVYDLLVDGIIEKRLRPGTHLNEVQLARSFDVPRSRIRRVLERLEMENVVQFERNRGAFVCLPTVKEALDVFETRRLLDAAVIRLVCERATAADVAELRAQVGHQADVLHNRLPGSGRVGADFHVLLARITRNEVLHDMMTLLMRRLSLIQSLYERASSVCLVDEHAMLVDLIEARDAAAAMALAEAHIEHIQKALDLSAERAWPHY